MDHSISQQRYQKRDIDYGLFLEKSISNRLFEIRHFHIGFLTELIQIGLYLDMLR